MGDRTAVRLTVLKEHSHQVKEIYKDDFIDEETHEVAHLQVTLVTFHFEEINYGELWDLDKLLALGIAYDSEWDRGVDFDEGEQVLRFTEQGEVVIKSLGDHSNSISIDLLLKHKDSLEELQEVIKTADEDRTTLPWLQQNVYGQRYRTRQLINPEG